MGFHLSPKLELSSLESLRRIVDANTSATILTKSYMATIDDPNIRQIPITDPVIRKTVAVVYRKDAFIDVTMGAFIKHLTRHYASAMIGTR